MKDNTAIIDPPFAGRKDRAQSVELKSFRFRATSYDYGYCNIYLKDAGSSTSNVCLSQAGAEKLRDALIERYPLRVVPSEEPALRRAIADKDVEIAQLKKQLAEAQKKPKTYSKEAASAAAAAVAHAFVWAGRLEGEAFWMSVYEALAGHSEAVDTVPVNLRSVPAPAARTTVLAKPAPKKGAKQTYQGNGNHSWEDVSSSTERLRVPGGWLYATTDGEGGPRQTTTFVPVPTVVGHPI